MDLRKVKPSTNFSDRTNPTRTEKFLHEMERRLNPVTAYRKFRSDLIDRGVIEIEGADVMTRNAERLVREKMNQRDALLAKGFTLEEAERIVHNLR